MRTSNFFPTAHSLVTEIISLAKHLRGCAAAWGEALWFCLVLLLFVMMGPFSAIAVVAGLWSLATHAQEGALAEPTSC